MAETDLHQLTVASIEQPAEQHPPVLVLRDERGRTLSIPIGLCEAHAIQLALDSVGGGQEGRGTVVRDRTTGYRPQTHDLLSALTHYLHAPVERVIIDDISKDTYYARLQLATLEGIVSLDCRPSDGVAVALRTHAPILATDAVLNGEQHG